MNTDLDNTENLKYISYYTLIPLLILYLFVPSIFMAKIDSSSYATGLLLFSLIIIGFGYFFGINNITHKLYAIKTIFYTICILLLCIIIHSFLALFITHTFNFIRAMGSMLILIVMTIASYLFVLIFQKTSGSSFRIALSAIFIIILFLSFLSIIGFKPLSYNDLFTKPIFPFVEPSHFALFTGPFYFWAICVQKNQKHKILIVLSFSLILMFISNLTIFCLILIGLYLSLRLKSFLIIVSVLLVLSIFFITFDISYYTERLDLENDNLSTLVWIQGWEEAALNLKSTYGLGVGIQQLGLKEPSGDASNSIYVIFGDYLNRYDGGTMGAKLISEFGVIGLWVILKTLAKVNKSLKFLVKGVLQHQTSPQVVFYHCCIIVIIIDMFIRSVGYMAPSFFMFIVGIIGLKIENNQNQ